MVQTGENVGMREPRLLPCNVRYYLVNGSIRSFVRRIGLFKGLFYSKFIILCIAVVMIEVLEI